MKIRVSTIPPHGLQIREKIPQDGLNARMNEGRDNDIFFTDVIHLDLIVTANETGAETRGSVRTKFKQPCSRCAEVIEKDLEVEANFLFAQKPEDGRKADYEDDIGISFYDGDHIELIDVVHEALILAISPYWHPPVDDKGDCQRCGRAVVGAKEQAPGVVSLGTLLKNAGLNGKTEKK